MKKYITPFILLFILSIACSHSKENLIDEEDINWKPSPNVNPAIKKPKILWIDAAANFSDFANSKENILRDLTLAKETGFTDVVVDIRPPSGDVLFQTSVSDAEQVSWLPAWKNGKHIKVHRTETWDYLQAFIDIGHRLGLKVHAGFNVMAGGYGDNLGKSGLLYRDTSKRNWATSEITSTGIINAMDIPNGTRFFNPAHLEVQQYICNLLKDLAKYNLDGIFLDRARYLGIRNDFSDLSKNEFEKYIRQDVPNFPADIMAVDVLNNVIQGKFYKEWLAFRAKTIHDFMVKAKQAVKSVNPNIKFGVYVGGWYASYYENGVNWASRTYNTHTYFPGWATPEYKNYGFAELMDQMLIGAYASPLSVYGTTEWTMEGFCRLAKEKTKNACPMVAGGPDVGNWDPHNKASESQENQAITNSVKACIDACDGYFLFDMIHLKMGNKWHYVKEGIEKAHQE